ncbi:MAG TPA: FtsX-like permease family protein [Armatimonadota bacterium]|nr:FtsX-like permease family protein [Armatimonadota bacterium]
MKYTLFALRNLSQRKVRTGLTVFSIAIAVAVLFTLLSFNTGYQKALNSQLQQMGVHAMVLPVGCPYEAASLVLKGGQIKDQLPESIVDKYITPVQGIQIAAPAFMSGIINPDEGRTDIYFGIDSRTIDLKNWWRILNKPGVDVSQWESLVKNDSNMMTKAEFEKAFEDDNALILGYDAALIELSTVGDEIYLPEKDKTFKVVGVLSPTGTQDDGFFYIPLRTAQTMFGKPGKITVVQIRFKDPTMSGPITEQLDKIPGSELVTMSELLGTMQNLMGSAKTLVFSIILIAITISALGVLNTVLMSVFERTREIGVMRATGAAKKNIFTLIWTETLVMVGLGGILGLGLALLGSRAMESVIRAAMLKMDMSIPIKGSLIALDPRVFVICLLFVFGIGVVAGLYPAFKASRARPIEALRMD